MGKIITYEQAKRGTGILKYDDKNKPVEPISKPDILADMVVEVAQPAPLYAVQKNKPQRTNIRFIF